MRRHAPLLAAALLAGAAAPAPAAVYTPTPMPLCSLTVTTRCHEAPLVNGAAPAPGAVTVLASLSDPALHPVEWPFVSVRLDGPGGAPLDPADVWSITLRTDDLLPAQVTGRARDVTVERGGSAAAGYTVTISGHPVRMAFTDSGCGGTGTCPPVADTLTTGTWDAQIDDARYYTEPADRLATRGFHFFSSTDWFSTPPLLDYDAGTITIDVANSHFEPDGTTVFHGTAELFLPDPMLTTLYHVDDPATLTAAAFAVTAGGGPAPTTTVTRLAAGVRVQLADLTFSRRRLRVTGRPTPAAPRDASGARTRATRAVLRFHAARARGSKVRGYRATCRAGGSVVRASARRSPLVVRGLVAGRAYRCSLAATSRAGLGRAVTVRIAARP